MRRRSSTTRWKFALVWLRLGSGLVERARSAGAIGYHPNYQTTAHAIIQRAAGEAGSVETGVMLAYIPAGTEYRDLLAVPSNDRLAAVTVYQPLAPAPSSEVVLPRRYRAVLRTIYERSGLRREAIESSPGHVVMSSQLETDFDSKRSLLSVDVQRIGADISPRVGELERAHVGDVTHVDLLMTDPALEPAVEELRACGFFFCALLPEYAGSDVLRLQRLRVGNWRLSLAAATQNARRLVTTIGMVSLRYRLTREPITPSELWRNDCARTNPLSTKNSDTAKSPAVSSTKGLPASAASHGNRRSCGAPV
jgi:hypothetical protein